jgi:DNA-binding response OmpR family regulator
MGSLVMYIKAQTCFKSKKLEIDFTAMKFVKKGIEIRLTRIEFCLLQYLAQYAGTVLTFKQLIEKLWSRNSTETEHNLEVHIYNLRKKIGTEYLRITNVYGTGFRLDINVNNHSGGSRNP